MEYYGTYNEQYNDGIGIWIDSVVSIICNSHTHTPITSIAAKDATCTEAGNTDEVKCFECGEVIQVKTTIPALGHSWGDWVVTKAAITTAEGIETRTCGRCGVKETRALPKIAKKANAFTVKTKTPSIKASKAAKKKQTVKKAKAFTIKNAQGAVTFKKAGGSKNLTISSTGNISIKKGTKKGIYKIKVTVTAAGNDGYEAGTKTVTVKVKVK